MAKYSATIERLIAELGRLPGIGWRRPSGWRFTC